MMIRDAATMRNVNLTFCSRTELKASLVWMIFPVRIQTFLPLPPTVDMR